MLKNGTSSKMSTLSLSWKHKNHQNAQIINVKNDKKWSKKCEKRGGLISALKPGPVVPPGIEKTPDQAARISQSGDFGHLSDILAILRGGRFLTHFSSFFTFAFLHFWWFSVFVFCHFFCFSDFPLFRVFLFSGFLINFVDFLLLWWILITFCH